MKTSHGGIPPERVGLFMSYNPAILRLKGAQVGQREMHILSDHRRVGEVGVQPA